MRLRLQMVIKTRKGGITYYHLGNYGTKQEIFRQSLILYIIKFLAFIGNTCEDAGKWIEVKNLHKKKTPNNGASYGFT